MTRQLWSYAWAASVYCLLIGFWIERHFSNSWGEIYYRWGIPLYRERYKRKKPRDVGAESSSRLLEMRQIDQETTFFRLGSFTSAHWGRFPEWSPVRGSIVKDPITGVFRITFLLNCYVAPFLISTAGAVLSTGTDSGKLTAIGVLVYVIWLVRRRFRCEAPPRSSI